ncbi:NHLP leader peptide family RiPP precursor [Solidesulfovibrio sp.]|uniref:NHLP leader peptide family RiPP precursor n=1 Tax=Solidesulfovibrio sp. TaxID=2910990 RepID=UPI0026324BCF|nr:NHLP leader peptide family RiPP precursor [Solidesulfovibrio sp.]
MDTRKQQDRSRVWARIVAKAWADEAFKERLMASPAAVLAQEGFEVPQGMAMTVVEASDGQGWLVLPRKALADDPEAEARIAAGICAPLF